MIKDAGSKFDDKSEQPIDLKSVNVDQMTNLSILTKALNILLVSKTMKLLNRYVLSYLRWVGT